MKFSEEKINLSELEILKGRKQISNGHMVLTPDEEGFIRVKLSGEKAKMCGLEWTEEKYLVIDMLADMDAMASVDVMFYSNNSNEPERILINYRMIPTKRVKMVVKLDELKSRRYFLPTLPGMLKGHVKGMPTDISEISRIEVLFHPGYSNEFKSLTIYGMYLTETLPDMTVIGEPMVDEMGQWIQKEWNTKTHSVAEMIAYLKKEYERAQTDNSYPDGWSRYGGYTGIKFDATGYFHTHYDGKRWWLVDPDGYAFFSNGVCYGARMGVYGFVDNMESLFSWLPDINDPEYSECWTTADKIPEYAKRNGVESGKNRYLFNFARANMIRAFGKENWKKAWMKINGARLKRWGFNTIGVGVNTYVDENVIEYLEEVKIPFVITLKNFPLTTHMVFRDFPDVFSDEYSKNSEEYAKQLLPFVGNPYMIGYFVNNEPEWRFQQVNLAERVFAHKEKLASKNALISILKGKYQNIEALNSAWNTAFTSFDDLYTPAEKMDLYSEQALRDMEELHAVLIEKYTSVLKDALYKVDPDHMNLGMRYNRFNKDDLAGYDNFDIFSFNRYSPSCVNDLDEASSVVNIPIIIGEWHIGGGDKGLLAHGLLSSPTQEERGKACEFYMQGAMVHPNCVGLHYFEMNDQPLLGRFDGECMQHGIIDVCNREYEELVNHFINTNHRLYDFVLGKIEPTKVQGIIRRPR
ncbi:MAG TPA: beta-galactosidase [Thermoclostridium sp.]